jgi:tol-pal system protein YbgF
MRNRPLLPIAAGVLSLILAGQALAQTSLDDPLDDRSAKRLDRMEKVMRELRAIVFQGRETGQPVVVQPADTENQIAALTERVNDLEQTLQRLNGQLETTNHALDQSGRDAAALRTENAQLREHLAALDQKIASISQPPPPPPETADQSAPPPPPPAADAASAFTAAKRALFDGDYRTAEAGFHDYVDRYGDTPKGQEARYYLAKTLIARKAWPEAATADIGAIRGWPQTSWAPDATLDLSRALLAMKKAADACQTLDELGRRYPKANTDVKNRAASVRTQAQCS